MDIVTVLWEEEREAISAVFLFRLDDSNGRKNRDDVINCNFVPLLTSSPYIIMAYII